MEGIILGIGLNVNNQSFADGLNATSMFIENNKTYDIKKLLKKIVKNIIKNINLLKKGKSKHIEIINKVNYLYNKTAYALINKKRLLVTVLQILPNNHLQVKYNDDILEVSTDEITFHKN